jgi:hypothetical protein
MQNNTEMTFMKQNVKLVTSEQIYATGYKSSDLCAGVGNITKLAACEHIYAT